jgi:hypothetical protein
MAVETITVADVNKGNGSWYNVELVGDDRVLATNKKALADLALESAGTEIQAEVGFKRNGEFDNYYLNKILDPDSPVAELAPQEDKPKRRATAKRTDADSPNPAQEAKQKSIQAQWAFGQAVQALVASGQEFNFPLDGETLKALAETAHAIQTGAQALASR